MCHHRIAAGLLQLSVLRHAKHELPEVTESAECCCTNCLPSSTTPTSLSRAKDLHWLPVRGRVDYKIAVLCYKAVKLQQPSYGLLSSYRQSRVLRSSMSDLLSTQFSLTNIAACRFSCCALTVWNSLHSFVRTADSFTSFRSQLDLYVCTTFVAAPLSAPLIPLPGLLHVIN